MNGANGGWHMGNERPLPFRPPTVDEALQYSPLSSIVPFSPSEQPSPLHTGLSRSDISFLIVHDTDSYQGIIPFPSAGPPSSSSIFTTHEERRAARRALDSFNTESSNTHSTSARLQKTLQDLQQLLNAEELTQL